MQQQQPERTLCLERPNSAPLYFEVTGPARCIPGKTKEDGAKQIVQALQQASEGQYVFSATHQQGEWLRTCKIVTAFNVGKKTVTYTKQQFEENIEENQGWLRWKAKARRVN